MGNGAYAPLAYFFVALAVGAFVIEAWAFVDAITRPTLAFPAAGKQTKPIWLIILGVAVAIGLYAAAYGGAIGFLSVAAFVASAVYLVDVRPKVKEIGKGRGSSNGPYGSW
jgi:hypothetical protein